jgi:hypothetical protein
MYLLPLVGTLLSGILSGSTFARTYGHRGTTLLSVFCLGISFVSSLFMWYEIVFSSSEVFINLFGSWFTVGSFNVYWSLYFDLTTVHLLLTVTSVSFAVHCYALVYMKQDPHLNLFMSYLSLFSFFMCVLVTGQDLIVMLVGWEGIQTQCLNGQEYMCCSMFKRYFYKGRIPADKRLGSHSSIFKQLLVGFMLGDGWLELHGKGARLGISLTEKFQDVAKFYKLILYALGYVESFELQSPSIRTKRSEIKPYYEIRTFSFSSLITFYNDWYMKKHKKDGSFGYAKIIPINIDSYLTPFALAVWIMGDGNGMKDGGFKISSHSFTKEQNQFVCNLLWEKYGIKANVLHEKGKNLYYIRIWKQSVTKLHCLIKPFLLPSCDYKFRHVKNNI